METAINDLNEALSIIRYYENNCPMASKSVAYINIDDVAKIDELISRVIETIEGGNS